MSSVEDIPSVRAPDYDEPLNFTYDSELDQKGGFRFTYENGEIRCSEAGRYSEVCRLAPQDINTIGRERPSFVYLDVGRWYGDKWYFGLISGPDCYLCEYIPGFGVPAVRNAAVQTFFAQMVAKHTGGSLRNGFRVVGYAQARNVSPATREDTHLYLLLPDCHLPPISWFYRVEEVSVLEPGLYRDPPGWFQSTGPFARRPHLYRGWYGLKAQSDNAHRRRTHESDIFGDAGPHLVRFLESLGSLGCRSRVHLIVVGDSFELWLNRDYQFEPSDSGPPSFEEGGVDRTAEWAAEVMLMNMDVMEAFRGVEGGGLAEVQYVWGNHEAYLMSADVTSQTRLQRRWPEYDGQNGDLHAEHGHRFDSWNFDNVSSWRGPKVANLVFWAPSIRRLDPPRRNNYVQGACLLFLSQRIDEGRKPFSFFCMGHTHEPCLRTVNINIEYSLHGVKQ